MDPRDSLGKGRTFFERLRIPLKVLRASKGAELRLSDTKVVTCIYLLGERLGQRNLGWVLGGRAPLERLPGGVGRGGIPQGHAWGGGKPPWRDSPNGGPQGERNPPSERLTAWGQGPKGRNQC